jgi:hypothetical protein
MRFERFDDLGFCPSFSLFFWSLSQAFLLSGAIRSNADPDIQTGDRNQSDKCLEGQKSFPFATQSIEPCQLTPWILVFVPAPA